MSRDAKGASERSGLELVTEMLSTTKQMFDNSDDADMLAELIDKRGLLMEEYDRLKKKNPYAADAIEKDKGRIRNMVAEMIDLDKSINASLQKMYAETRHDLESSAANTKILGYANNAVASSSGNYLDIKK